MDKIRYKAESEEAKKDAGKVNTSILQEGQKFNCGEGG
jgi:hypothetical protein